jgi:hypothetical protein
METGLGELSENRRRIEEEDKGEGEYELRSAVEEEDGTTKGKGVEKPAGTQTPLGASRGSRGHLTLSQNPRCCSGAWKTRMGRKKVMYAVWPFVGIRVQSS